MFVLVLHFAFVKARVLRAFNRRPSPLAGRFRDLSVLQGWNGGVEIGQQNQWCMPWCKLGPAFQSDSSPDSIRPSNRSGRPQEVRPGAAGYRQPPEEFGPQRGGVPRAGPVQRGGVEPLGWSLV